MFYKFRLSSHNLIKPTLLELLDKQNSTSSFCDETQTVISKTDFFVDVGLEREYWNFLLPYLFEETKAAYEQQFEYDNFSEQTIVNCWFQQYTKNDSHPWHRHHHCTFNNVYYLELPKDAPGTELKIPVTNETIMPNVEEGDVLIFPSAFLHRSPFNNSNKNKTVIAFNVV